MKLTPETTERIREARRNLAQVEELHAVVMRVLKETDALLASLDEPGDTEGSKDTHPFTRR